MRKEVGKGNICDQTGVLKKGGVTKSFISYIYSEGEVSGYFKFTSAKWCCMT